MKSLIRRMFPAAIALAATGQLHAQPGPAVGETPEAVSPAVSTNLTPAEMTTRADELEAQVGVDIRHVQHLQATARKEQDIIKLSCINDRMIRLKAEANMFDTARQELTGALETQERFATFDKVVRAAGRVHRIREEADSCAGEQDLASEASNTFDGPDIIDDPTDGMPFDDDVGGGGLVEPPAYASPFE